MTVTFLSDRKEKVKIGKINFVGNEQFNDKRLRRTFKKTHQKSINFFKGTKLNENDYEADKELLIDFYNSRGYRNATIIRDSIYPINEKRLGIDLEVSEGNKYYIRNVSWVGNSVYETEGLQQMFGVKKGDNHTIRRRCTKQLGIAKETDPEASIRVVALSERRLPDVADRTPPRRSSPRTRSTSKSRSSKASSSPSTKSASRAISASTTR